MTPDKKPPLRARRAIPALRPKLERRHHAGENLQLESQWPRLLAERRGGQSFSLLISTIGRLFDVNHSLILVNAALEPPVNRGSALRKRMKLRDFPSDPAV